MKKTGVAAISVSLLLSASCGNNAGKAKHFPKPGTVVASAEMPVTDDPLNKFIFSVKIIADSNVKSGIYDIDVDYGPNFAEGQLTMPKGEEDLQPIMRKGSQPYTYIVGFKVAGDTTFYDYFEVSSSKANTKMQYIKAYTF
jgi:hypothetical protein